MIFLAFRDICDPAGLGLDINASRIGGLHDRHAVTVTTVGDGHGRSGNEYIRDTVVGDGHAIGGKTLGTAGEMYEQL